jgi:hypothetical protein
MQEHYSKSDRLLGHAAHFLVALALIAAALSSAVGDTGTNASVTLEWDPDTDPDAVGYNLYYGGASQTYTNMVAVGDATNTTISNLLPGVQYFFAATAIDIVGLESDFSNEMSCQVPAELVVTPASQSRTYGAANPTLSGTITGLQNGDNITATFSTAATPGSPVGTYSIVPTLIDPGGKLINYNVSLNNGTLTVSPAALTITAANASKLYGAALPALTAGYGGFLNGDTASSLTPPPTLTTMATAASPVGSYPIQMSGSASPNYAISFVSGTLTILPAAAAVLVTSSANPSLPGAVVTFTAALSAVAPGAGIPTGMVQFIIDRAVAGSPAPLSGSTASYATSTLGHGTHTVAAQYAGDGNFTGTTNILAGTQVVDTPPLPGLTVVTYDSATGAQMSLATLLGEASDADGDPITLASMAMASANGGSVSISSGWVFYVPAPGFTNTDTFSYAISDGYCSPVTGTVTLSLRCDNGSSANLTMSALGNGSYAISGSGVPGRLYALQFADGGQTAHWQALGQALADPNGLFGFIDPDGSPQRLYQTVCP